MTSRRINQKTTTNNNIESTFTYKELCLCISLCASSMLYVVNKSFVYTLVLDSTKTRQFVCTKWTLQTHWHKEKVLQRILGLLTITNLKNLQYCTVSKFSLHLSLMQFFHTIKTFQWQLFVSYKYSTLALVQLVLSIWIKTEILLQRFLNIQSY